MSKKNPHYTIRLEWNPCDVFIGVYIRGPRMDRDLEPGSNNYYWNVWICLVPCLPIHIRWMRRYIFGADFAVYGELVCEKCGRAMILQPVVDSAYATSETVGKHGHPYKECFHHQDGTQANSNCGDWFRDWFSFRWTHG